MKDDLAAKLNALLRKPTDTRQPTVRQLLQKGGGGVPGRPEGGWSNLEQARLMFGIEHDLTPDEALALEGENQANWRDQAAQLKAARGTPLEADLERKVGAPQRRPTASYGIGNDNALMADLKRKLGI